MNELLAKYRRILDSIHSLGNIYYDRGRFEAYKLIALKASKERSQAQEEAPHETSNRNC